MIDLNKRMHESLNKVHYYGSWLTYGGLVVMLASILIFVVEFMKLMKISRMASV